MVYYTIYIRDLQNSTGYIDIGLEDEQLLKDYAQYLDVGLKSHRKYPIANPGGSKGRKGLFCINLSEITALTVMEGQKH